MAGGPTSFDPMIHERVERRVLGAVRFVDAATLLPVLEPLVVDAVRVTPNARPTRVRWLRNRSGCYAIADVPGLEAHRDAFANPPDTPASGSVRVDFAVRDPARRYLARRGRIDLPRDAAPEDAGESESLFRIVDVPMYRAPAAAFRASWAVVRASVPGDTADAGLGGALIRIARADTPNDVLARGLTDDRGEALVIVTGLASTVSPDGDGPVLTMKVEARIEVIADPNGPAIPDPDDLEERRDTLRRLTASATLTAGGVAVIPSPNVAWTNPAPP